MMFEWILVAAPVAFSALIFGLALGTEPIDLSLHEITTPSSLEERGFRPETLDDLLERKISSIVDAAGSSRETGKIDIGTSDTAINAYAQIVNVEVPVRATQRLLDMVDYVAETHFLIAGDQDVVATLRIRDSNTLEIAQYKEYKYPPDNLSAMLDAISSDIVGFLDPYILSVYLYKKSVKNNPTTKYEEVIAGVKKFIDVSDPSLRPWFYGLLGQIAENVKDPELAIAYYKEALSLDKEFYLGHVNWGRVLFDQGHTLDAIDQYMAALAINPRIASAYLFTAQAFLELERFSDAFAALARAGQLEPEFVDVYQTRANIYERLGLPKLAQVERHRAEIALKRQPHQNLFDTL